MSSRGKRFKTLTDEWVGEKLKTVINVKQRDTIYKWLINYILPELGNKPYNVYNYKAMQNILEKLKSKPETAKRVRGICAEIYMFGAQYDPICSAISRDVRSMEVVVEDQDKKRKYLAASDDIDLLRRICETRFFRATGSQYREPLAHGDQSRRRGAESHRSKHKYKEPPELRRRQLFVFNQLNVWKYCL